MNKYIYLDYSASTPVNKEILDKFYQDNLEFVGNSNSIHKLGRICKEKIDLTTENILNSFLINDEYEVIYTSGASEANNLAIKGVAKKNKKGRIISTKFEHSSVIAPLSYLQKEGFVVEFVKSDKNGLIDLNDLERLMGDDVILVSVGAVNSEIGILQPINEIKKIVHNYSKAMLHIDMTQCVGKCCIDYNEIDMFSYSAHKIYGIKGIGALIKKKNIKLECQIQGGTSTTKYRSGTPMHPLIFSLGYVTTISLHNINENYLKVKQLHDYFIDRLKLLSNVVINSNSKCIPHIINVSFLGLESKKLVLELEKNDIYISNHSACSSNDEISKGVYELTNDEKRAKSSVRFSISHLTTTDELDKVIEVLEKLI